MPLKSLYEQYGNNEPYTEPEGPVKFWDPSEPTMFLQLMIGPSANFYVGPEEVHYAIPKRLLYHYSDFAKACLEGNFFEASANAIWLPDVESEVFQWLWQWFYTQRLNVFNIDRDPDFAEEGNVSKACELLCQVHMLGERLLVKPVLLSCFQEKISTVIKIAKGWGNTMPWTADIIHQVLSKSTPYQFCGEWSSWENPSLRPFLLGSLRNFEFYTSFDFLNYGEIFKLDGQFAAELMTDMASELQWAVELWGAQTESSVDVAEKKLQLAREEGNSQSITKRPRGGIWLALRYACTYSGCTTTDFRAYSECFELDGLFTAEILNFMATELKWVVERWGLERGPKVDVTLEKEDEKWNEVDYDNIDRICQRNMYR